MLLLVLSRFFFGRFYGFVSYRCYFVVKTWRIRFVGSPGWCVTTFCPHTSTYLRIYYFWLNLLRQCILHSSFVANKGNCALPFPCLWMKGQSQRATSRWEFWAMLGCIQLRWTIILSTNLPCDQSWVWWLQVTELLKLDGFLPCPATRMFKARHCELKLNHFPKSSSPIYPDPTWSLPQIPYGTLGQPALNCTDWALDSTSSSFYNVVVEKSPTVKATLWLDYLKS